MKLKLEKRTKIMRGKNGNTVEPNPDGSINVNLVEDVGLGVRVVEHAEAASVPKDTETTLVSYTVPTGKIFLFKGAQGNGLDDAHFRLFFNAVRKGWLNNAWTKRYVDFNFEGILVAETQVKITVEHWENGSGPFDFQGTIHGQLFDAP